MKAICKLAGIVALLCETAGQSYAKHIDYTPDLTSAVYWDTHHIVAVRVAVVGKDETGREYITWALETRLSEGPVEQAQTIPVAHLWIGSYGEEQPRIAVNSRFILYYPKDGRGPSVAVSLDNGSEGPRMLNSLLQIAKLRANGGDLAAYQRTASSSDPIVSLYSLRGLLDQAGFEPQGGFVAALLQMRDEQSRPAQARVLANRLANRLQGKPDLSDTEYSWLQASLAGSANGEWTDLMPFVDRLLEFENKRTESVAFFTQLALEPSAPESVRVAAYSTFDDSRIFDFQKPDGQSERVFQTCLEMLKDGDPAMRGAGAALLHNISAHGELPDRSAYLQRSRTAVAEALAAENDDAARHQMDQYLKMIVDGQL